MQISNAGLSIVKKFEGFEPRPSNCPAKDCSIGYGHLIHLGSVCGVAFKAPFAAGISEEQGTQLLLGDVSYAEHVVEQLVKLPLTQGQYDALMSFTYNEGAGRLKSLVLSA